MAEKRPLCVQRDTDGALFVQLYNLASALGKSMEDVLTTADMQNLGEKLTKYNFPEQTNIKIMEDAVLSILKDNEELRRAYEELFNDLKYADKKYTHYYGDLSEDGQRFISKTVCNYPDPGEVPPSKDGLGVVIGPKEGWTILCDSKLLTDKN